MTAILDRVRAWSRRRYLSRLEQRAEGDALMLEAAGSFDGALDFLLPPKPTPWWRDRWLVVGWLAVGLLSSAITHLIAWLLR